MTIHAIQPDFDPESGFFLLRLRKEDIGLGDQPVTFAGKTFAPKDEVHITIIGSALGASIVEGARAQPQLMDWIRKAIVETPWSYQLLDSCYHIIREEGMSERGYAESIIRMVDVPALTTFYRQLEAQTALSIPPRPTHVTLYTYEDKKGIGVATWDEFERRVHATVDRSRLSAERDR